MEGEFKYVCEWYGQCGDMMGTYETDCGETFTINDGTVAENKFKYCPYCGGELDVYEYDRWQDINND